MLGGREQVVERLPPTRAQRRDVHRGAQRVEIASGQVEQRVDVGHAERVRADAGPDDLVAGLHVPLADHAQIEAGPVVRDEQRRHSGSPSRMPTRKQVTRGWVTSNSASPIA